MAIQMIGTNAKKKYCFGASGPKTIHRKRRMDTTCAAASKTAAMSMRKAGLVKVFSRSPAPDRSNRFLLIQGNRYINRNGATLSKPTASPIYQPVAESQN